jgi:hypothetical protein
MVVSKAICEIDGLRAREDHCMPVGPTVFKLDSQITSVFFAYASNCEESGCSHDFFQHWLGCLYSAMRCFYQVGQSYLIHLLPYSVRNHGCRQW